MPVLDRPVAASRSLRYGASSFNIRQFQRSQRMPRSATGWVSLPNRRLRYIPQPRTCREASKLQHREPGLIEGFLLCLRDSDAVRLQSSSWKRRMLVFSSGVCLEVALLPLLMGSDSTWHLWVLAALFVPLGVTGLLASRFGDDRLVERLLVIPKLDLRI